MITDRRSFLAAGFAAAGLGQEREGAVRIGAVNVKTCLEKYDRMKEVEGEITALRDRFAREGEELRKKIALLTEQLDQVKNAPAAYFETVRLRGHAEYDLKLNQEVAQRRVRDLAVDYDARITADLRRAVALVAPERALQLVVRIDDAGGGSREVLFHEPGLDITPLVLARLNTEWKKARVCPTCKRKVAEPVCRDCKKP